MWVSDWATTILPWLLTLCTNMAVFQNAYSTVHCFESSINSGKKAEIKHELTTRLLFRSTLLAIVEMGIVIMHFCSYLSGVLLLRFSKLKIVGKWKFEKQVKKYSVFVRAFKPKRKEVEKESSPNPAKSHKMNIHSSTDLARNKATRI